VLDHLNTNKDSAPMPHAGRPVHTRPEDQSGSDDTLVCRCEEITRGEVKEAVAAGARTIGEVKMILAQGWATARVDVRHVCSNAIVAPWLPRTPPPPVSDRTAIRPPLHRCRRVCLQMPRITRLPERQGEG